MRITPINNVAPERRCRKWYNSEVRVHIIGGGVFGLSAAAVLGQRGHRVELFEAGEIPSEKAASRDISKALRLDYGPECVTYAPWVARSREMWLDLEVRTGRKVFHEDGFLALSSRWGPGVFEYESFRWLTGKGYPIRRMEPAEAARRFPLFRYDGIHACTFNPIGGWLDPMEALPALADMAQDAGATIRTGVRVDTLAGLKGGATLVTAGAWIAGLLPDLGLAVRSTLQHETLFKPADLGPFSGGRLPVWSYDLAEKGWYGFGPHPGGWIKVSCHNPGEPADPDGPRTGDPGQARRIESFVKERIPILSHTPSEGRTCLYTMSPDGTFLFDRVPGRPGLFVAGCGSGHAFKFGLLLGEWAADLVEGKPVPKMFRADGKGGPRVV